MKNTTFIIILAALCGVFVGAGLLYLGTQVESGFGARTLVVTRANGTVEDIRIYRGEDCRRWGEVITRMFETGATYVCKRD